MGFKDQLTTDAGVFFNQDEFAEAAVYNDGTADHDITVILDETGDTATGRNAAKAQIQVLMTEVADPQYQQTISMGGLTWTIDQKEGKSGYLNDGLAWILPVYRSQRVGASWK